MGTYMNGIEQQAMPMQDLWKIKIKYHTVGTFPHSNWTIVKNSKIDTPNTHIHERLLSLLGIGSLVISTCA
jgi:hypothetical protein